MTTETTGGRNRSPRIAAFLSFLWPGLGQWYAGARRAAVVFALPVVVVFLVLLSSLANGPESIVLQLLSPGTALTIAVLVALLGLWRIASMIDVVATLGSAASWRRPSLMAPFAAMVVVVVVIHLAVAGLAWSFYQAGSKIFTTEPDTAVAPPPAASGSGDITVLPVATVRSLPASTIS